MYPMLAIQHHVMVWYSRGMSILLNECTTPVKPSHRVLGFLVVHLSSRHCSKHTVVPWVYIYKGPWGCFPGFGQIHMGCQMEYVILIHLLSLVRSQFLNNLWLSKYIHWVVVYEVIACECIWRCTLQLHKFWMHGYLKPSQKKVSLHCFYWLTSFWHLSWYLSFLVIIFFPFWWYLNVCSGRGYRSDFMAINHY